MSTDLEINCLKFSPRVIYLNHEAWTYYFLNHAYVHSNHLLYNRRSGRMAESVNGLYANSIIIWIVLLCYCVYICEGHPQCLDSRPPFKSHSKLTFCGDYEQFGCCTSNDDFNLRERYLRISSLIPPSHKQMWARCSAFAKTFLCQTCSPYAAHIFDAEKSHSDTNYSLMPRAFPALCGPYCKDFYFSCKDLVKYYMEEVGNSYIEEAVRLDTAINQNVSEFCSKVAVLDKDYCYPELLSNPILNGNISIEKVSKEGCICVQPFAKNKFRNPIFLKHAGDGSNRLFIGEQVGFVHIMFTNGTILPTPFMNIQADVKTTNNTGDERGLLGMTFHPNYLTNRKLYIYYSTPLHENEKFYGNHKIRIEELMTDANNPNQIDYSYSRVILEVFEPWWNHNGGELLFGDDGYLYIFIGDGGRAGDPLRSGQSLNSMLGKVHRIDVDRVDPDRHTEYSIPPDNPFADGMEALPEIYAYGVRNIWRCGKDRGDPITKAGKGRILCGDVGQSKVEEIDLIEKGANYGWNLKEGTADYCPNCKRAKPEVNLTDPVAEYTHNVGKSVTGGHFYRGCESPNLNGYYIYGDFMSGKIFRLLEPKDPNVKKWDHKELNMCGSDWCVPPLSNDYETSIISFGEDEHGEVYMLSTKIASTLSYRGTIYKIVDPMRRGHPEYCESLRNPSMKTPPTTTPYRPEPTSPVYAGTTVSEAVLTGSSVSDQHSNGGASSSNVSILDIIRQWLQGVAM